MIDHSSRSPIALLISAMVLPGFNPLGQVTGAIENGMAPRFAEGVLAPSARRTASLDSIVHHLGLALGGRSAAGFAKRLMLPVSNDTLLTQRLFPLGPNSLLDPWRGNAFAGSSSETSPSSLPSTCSK